MQTQRQRMITAAACDAIAATLLLGSVGFEREPDDNGERFIWLEHTIVNKLKYLRGPGETFSDVIHRVAAGERRS
jgi:hypothetical protein